MKDIALSLSISWFFFGQRLSIIQTELSFFLLAASVAFAPADADEAGAVTLKRCTLPCWFELVHGGRGGRGSVDGTCTNDWLTNSSCSFLCQFREQKKKAWKRTASLTRPIGPNERRWKLNNLIRRISNDGGQWKCNDLPIEFYRGPVWLRNPAPSL